MQHDGPGVVEAPGVLGVAFDAHVWSKTELLIKAYPARVVATFQIQSRLNLFQQEGAVNLQLLSQLSAIQSQELARTATHNNAFGDTKPCAGRNKQTLGSKVGSHTVRASAFPTSESRSSSQTHSPLSTKNIPQIR